MHDGNVLGVPYFECAPKHGVFAQVAQLHGSAAAAAVADAASAPTEVTLPAQDFPAPAANISSAPRASEDEECAMLRTKEQTVDGAFWLGLQVKWRGKHGIVRYIGNVKFAPGEWIGVEMIEAKGMHDGNVLGVPYFRCSPQMGVFTRPGDLDSTGTSDASLMEQTIRQVEAAAAGSRGRCGT